MDIIDPKVKFRNWANRYLSAIQKIQILKYIGTVEVQDLLKYDTKENKERAFVEICKLMASKSKTSHWAILADDVKPYDYFVGSQIFGMLREETENLIH